MSRTILTVVVPLLVIAAQAVQAPAEWAWPPSPEVAEQVEVNLSRHHEAHALRSYIEEADAEHAEALEFLLAWLPPSDLGGLPAEFLIENVDLALEAWHEAPWRDEVDPYVFHTYVLPHRATQEPVQRWRPKLRELIAPRIEGMSLGEAALEVNRFAREWVTYQPSSRRDQGPLTTMERGIGRCEEEMIFAICALRSVGIPARYCAVPCWCTGDGNHAWTEIFAGKDEGWHYIGSCEPSGCLDNAWFTGTARRTGVVFSSGYGEAPVPGRYAEALYKQEKGITTLNSIDVYSDPGTLVLKAPEGETNGAEAGSDGEPPDAHVHTFNWGAAQPLASQPLGTDILMGPGDYLVTAEIDSAPWSALVSVRSGERTELELAPGFGALDAPVWLRYPIPPETKSQDCPIDEDDPVWLRHQRDLARRDLDRCRRSRPPDEWIEFLAGRAEASEIDGQMDLAGPLTGEWTSTILATGGDTLETAVDLLLEMDIKDFYEMDRERLPSVLGEVVRVRAARAQDERGGEAGTVVPDSLWHEYVLSPRLYFQEGTMSWWTALPWLGDGDTTPSAERLLEAFRGHVTEADETRLGPVATPEDTWRSGHASPSSARACLVGLLRRHGIPARAGMGVDYVEAWEDGDWTRLVPFEAEGEEKEEKEAVAEEGYLAVTYFDQDRPLENIETWRQTRLTRFEEGRFESWYLGQLSEGDALVEWSLPPDGYWLFGGLRSPRGEPRFVARRIEMAAGDSLVLKMDVGIPLAEWDAADLVQKEWDAEVPVEATRGGGAVRLPGPAGGARLLVLALTGHEASFRHLTELEQVDWEAAGVSYMPLHVGGLPDHPTEASMTTVDAATAESFFGIKRPKDQLPLTILLDESGETLVWLRGLRHDMPEHLERVLGDR